MSTSEMPTIVEALSGVMEDVGAVRKQEINSHQKFNFRGVDAVVNAVSPALRRHGVVVAPTVLEKELKETKTARGAVMANVYVTVKYTFHGPAGDSIEAVVAAESFDSGDKATAKAMSVAFRTALLQTLSLPTDEVDDPDHSTYERAASPVLTPQTPPQAPPVKMTTAQIEEAGVLMEALSLDEAKIEAAVSYASQRRTSDFSELFEGEAQKLIAFLRPKVEEVQKK